MNPESTTTAATEQSAAQKTVCPFCGLIKEDAQACPRCTMQDTPATRQATAARIGPWYVLQTRNPSAPGMKFATLAALVERGQVTAKSVVRGPTTGQFWKLAGQVKGLSRQFGLCYSCGGQVEKNDNLCPHCRRLQEPPINPDVLLETAAETPRPAGEPAAPRLPVRREITAPSAMQAGVPEDQGILSAKELAAAFHLDLAPPRRRRSVWRFVMRVIWVVLVLLILGGGTFLALDEQMRGQVLRWANKQYSQIKDWAVAAPKLAPPVNSAPPVILPPALPIKPTVFQPAPTPPAKPVNVEPAPVLEAPKVEQPAAPPVKAAPVDPAPEARRLWWDAINAEQQQDYRKAVDLYQQIKQLPAEVWPGGLDVRLQMARQQLLEKPRR